MLILLAVLPAAAAVSFVRGNVFALGALLVWAAMVVEWILCSHSTRDR